MTPEQFIATWKNNPPTERAGAQAHFDDLCDLLSVDKPRDPNNYCFERGAHYTDTATIAKLIDPLMLGAGGNDL